jgi:transcriptional regulator with PAS, ATPase and Fis domain
MFRLKGSAMEETSGSVFLVPGVVGCSTALRELFRVVRLAADSPAPVLIGGESGTGKEVVARALHRLGVRSERPFVAVNCGALPDSLLESELFGHAAGSFTGAVRDKVGLLEAAGDGTIFLDEIAEVSLNVQVKLLRALQEGEIMRVGEVTPRRIRARIVAATNRTLQGEVAAGRFREDLFYRLHVIPLWVPPLRDRPEDIHLLVAHFLRRWAERSGGRTPRLGSDALRCLVEYWWPGNVRELENELERLLTLSGQAREITVGMLSPRVRMPREERAAPPDSLQRHLDDLETQLIREALDRTRGNKSRAALHLGVSRQGLYKKMARLGLAEAVDPVRGNGAPRGRPAAEGEDDAGGEAGASEGAEDTG